MAYEFHKDKSAYFRQQYDNATANVVPFIHQYTEKKKQPRVLEIGCAEGGVIKAFIDQGYTGVGIELSESRLQRASQFLAEDVRNKKLQLINRNIYDIDPKKDFEELFDVIVLKDVIEHIHDQPKLMKKMHDFLKEDGVIFFGFPPWYMPFGGHQQICDSKLSKIPFIHLLPKALYKSLLEKNNERTRIVDEMLEIKETQISIEQFERYSKQTGYRIIKRQLYLINPIYKYKFGLKARKQLSLLSGIPFLRNFVSTAAFYIITPSKK